MTPINEKGMNSDYISYFSMEEYVDRIKLSNSLLAHLQETNQAFDSYMKKLSSYDENYIVDYWIFLLYHELKASQGIENLRFDITKLVDKSVFFDTLSISNKRIHELHNSITSGELEPTFSYRSVPVNVSRFNEQGEEEIFWRGVNPEDVSKFMNDFIKIYKQGGTSLLFSNPFLASALMHLLFVRIHPYNDGNGRTARVIHNIKFTEMINKLWGTKLKLSPLHLSKSILLNKITYVKRINNIYFDDEHDTNAAINRWFDFILDMADEQIYRSNGQLEAVDSSFMKEISKRKELLRTPSNVPNMGLGKLR